MDDTAYRPSPVDDGGSPPARRPVPATSPSAACTRSSAGGARPSRRCAASISSIERGEFVSLLGPSGCGKSTLLRVIGGLTGPDAGTVDIGGATPDRGTPGQAVRPGAPDAGARAVGRPSSATSGSCRNLDSSRRGGARPLSDDEVDELIDTVGLGRFRKSYPHELSGGMQQRVSLVRGFALGAPILLMDEPFAALDEITRADMRYLLLELWERTGTTVVFVTHSITEAVILSDRVVVMAARPGRIAADRADHARPAADPRDGGRRRVPRARARAARPTCRTTMHEAVPHGDGPRVDPARASSDASSSGPRRRRRAGPPRRAGRRHRRAARRRQPPRPTAGAVAVRGAGDRRRRVLRRVATRRHDLRHPALPAARAVGHRQAHRRRPRLLHPQRPGHGVGGVPRLHASRSSSRSSAAR